MKFAAAGLFLVLLLASCSKQSLDSLEVGQCFDDPHDRAARVSSVQIVECSTPHHNEVYFKFQVETSRPLPEDDREFNSTFTEALGTVDTEVETKCTDAFEDYVGRPLQTSSLEFSSFLSGSSNDGDLSATCFLYKSSLVDLDGTVKGTDQ